MPLTYIGGPADPLGPGAQATRINPALPPAAQVQPIAPLSPFQAPTALDPDLANLLAAYLASRDANLAGIDQNQALLGTQYGDANDQLHRSQGQAITGKQTNLADNGIGQSGIALKALQGINQQYDDQGTNLTGSYNQQLADLAQKRIMASQQADQQSASLWSQNTERAAGKYGDQVAQRNAAAAAAAQQAAANQIAAAQAALPQAQISAPVIPETPAAAPAPAIRQPAASAAALPQQRNIAAPRGAVAAAGAGLGSLIKKPVSRTPRSGIGAKF